MVLVRRQLGDACSDLFLSFVAIFRKLRKELPRMARRVFEPLFDRKTIRFLAFFNDLVVGREDIGSVAGYDAVYLNVDFVLIQGAFEPLVPAFRFDLTLGINLCRLTSGCDPGIDRGFAILGNFGLLAEENHGKSRSFHRLHGFGWIKRLQHRNIAT